MIGKQLRIVFVSILVSLFFAAQPAAAQEGGDAEARELIQNMAKAYDGIKSHRFTWRAEGMDTFTKDRQKEMSGSLDKYAKKAGVTHEVEQDAKLVRGKYEIEFMKPYLNQMLVVRSDFTPKIVWGTLITYRSDKNQDVWWAKPKISPVAIKRSVKDDDAGGSLTGNWTSALLHLLYYADNADLSLLDSEECPQGPCHVLRVTFDWEKRPEWNHKKPPFKQFQVPDLIEDIIWKGMLDLENQKFSHIDYYIDKEHLVIVDSKEYINEKFHWRNTFADFEINTLTEKDF